MIQSFADPEAELIWSGRRSRKLPADIQNVALRKLRLLNQARALGDLRVPPGNRLDALRADRRGQHSIRINDQWRNCFFWDEGGPTPVGRLLSRLTDGLRSDAAAPRNRPGPEKHPASRGVIRNATVEW